MMHDHDIAFFCLNFSVKERCLAQQKKRRQRATKKICIFIGSFILCFSPYVITRQVPGAVCGLAVHIYELLINASIVFFFHFYGTKQELWRRKHSVSAAHFSMLIPPAGWWS